MEDGSILQSEDDEFDARWSTRTWWLIATVGLLRVFYLTVVPLDLVHDEAYYWDWSRHPAWGYYSKPPMVAWLIGLSTWWGDSTAFFVRLPAALLSTAGSFFTARLARCMYGSRAGLYAAALALLSPGNCVLSLVMTIDAPLMFAWSVALYGFWRILEQPRTLVPYTLCAAAVGFGSLSKQTMLGSLPLAFLFLAISEGDRHRLRDWRVWATAIAGISCIAPVLWWNQQHGWVTLVHTREHFAAEPVTLLRGFLRSLEFIAAQMLVISPVTWCAMAAFSIAAVRAGQGCDRRQRYLLCFSVLPWLAVAVLSLRQRVEANWPAPLYVAGFVLVAGAWENSAAGATPRWRRAALTCGLVFSLLTMLLPFLITGLGLRGSRFDAAVRMWGWQDLARCVDQRLQLLPQGRDTLLVSDRRRGVASELAFYLPHRPDVFVFQDSGTVTSQYDLWAGSLERYPERDALILTEHPELHPTLVSSFRRVNRLPDISIPIGGNRTHHYHAWHGQSLVSWPDPPTVKRRR